MKQLCIKNLVNVWFYTTLINYVKYYLINFVVELINMYIVVYIILLNKKFMNKHYKKMMK